MSTTDELKGLLDYFNNMATDLKGKNILFNKIAEEINKDKEINDYNLKMNLLKMQKNMGFLQDAIYQSFMLVQNISNDVLFNEDRKTRRRSVK